MNTTSNVPTDAQRDAAIAKAKQENNTRAFERHMLSRIEQADEEVAAFTAQLQDKGIEWALQWKAEAAAKISAEAELWRAVRRNYTDPNLASYNDPIRSIRPVFNKVERQLLNNWIRSRSTSEFANVTSGAVADGYARFREEAAGMIEFLNGETVTPSE